MAHKSIFYWNPAFKWEWVLWDYSCQSVSLSVSLSASLSVITFSPNRLWGFFWNFAWSLSVFNVENYGVGFFEKKSHSGDNAWNGLFWILQKNYICFLGSNDVLNLSFKFFQTPCSGNTGFSSNTQKCSRPIRLQDSLNQNISRSLGDISLIFCM